MIPITTFSPGKIIISGEHAVVAGHPALVSSINLGISVQLHQTPSAVIDDYSHHILKILTQKINTPLSTKWDISAHSDIPQSTGLGSSAAFAHSLILAVMNLLNINLKTEEIFNLVWQAEHFKHGQSSGLDPAAVVFGGLQTFQNQAGTVTRNMVRNTALTNKDFWLINSGSVSESRKDLILGVQTKAKTDNKFKQIMQRIGSISRLHANSLNQGNFDYELIIENQRLLEELGVVGTAAKQIVQDIEKNGGVAKIIGTGGVKTGSGFLLAYHPDADFFETYLQKKSWSSKRINLGV